MHYYLYAIYIEKENDKANGAKHKQLEDRSSVLKGSTNDLVIGCFCLFVS